MTDIKVTQADREAADKAFDIAFSGDTDGIDDTMRELFARHRLDAQRPLEKALHILQYCPDKQKKAEVLIATAIKQAKGE